MAGNPWGAESHPQAALKMVSPDPDPEESDSVLERQLQSELNLSGGAGRGRDQSRGRADRAAREHDRIRGGEVWVIEKVETFGPKLEIEPLGHPGIFEK